MSKHYTFLISAFFVAFSAASAGFYLEYKESKKLTQENAVLQENLSRTKLELASTTQKLNGTESILQSVQENLGETQKELNSLKQDLDAERAKVGPLEERVKEITGTVGNLVKLKSLDQELLQKYSKVYFLNEHFVPKALVPINSEYVYPDKVLLIHASVSPFLRDLLNEAVINSNVDLLVTSAYRSFGEQSEVKSSYTVVYGAGTANQFSADQGYSEHQLGTTVDFTTKDTRANFGAFKNTPAYRWLQINAHKYGFTLSYPEGNSYYKFEPWHWRFVGRELAGKLHSGGKYFYDLDQREIDTYLLHIFDY